MDSLESVPSILINSDNCAGCLICQMRCSIEYEGSFNPAKARIMVEWTDEGLGMGFRVSYKDECIKCGICAKSCPYGALEIR